MIHQDLVSSAVKKEHPSDQVGFTFTNFYLLLILLIYCIL